MTYILNDAPAAQLNYHRISLVPQSSSPTELLSAALGISHRKARSLLNDIAEDSCIPSAPCARAKPLNCNRPD